MRSQSLEVSKIKKNKKTSKNFGHLPKFFEVFLFFFIFETSSDCDEMNTTINPLSILISQALVSCKKIYT
jgi:hypothetical protein